MMKSKRMKKPSIYNFEDRKAFVFCYIMIGIPFAFFILFWVSINFSSFTLAFQDMNGDPTWQNFADVFKGFKTKDVYIQQNLTQVLFRTLAMWFSIYILCLIPSLFSSYILYKKMPGHYIFRVIFMIPTILAGLVWIMIMKYMVGVGGPVMELANKMGIKLSLEVQQKGLLGSTATAFPTILIISVLPHIIGFNMVITGAYARIPIELFEVGKLEGLGFIREFFVISLPLVWPTLTTLMLANFASMFTFDGNIFLYTKGGYETATMGFYIFELTRRISDTADTVTVQYGYPAAIGMTLTFITIPVVFLGRFVLEKAIPTVEY